MDKNIWGVFKELLARLGLITQMENTPTPGESCIAYSLLLGSPKW